MSLQHDNRDRSLRNRRATWWDKLLGLVLISGLIVACVAIWPRLQAERTLGPVEIIVDWVSIEEAADAAGETVETMLSALRQAGAVSVAVPEMTIAEAAERGWILALRRPDLIGWPVGEWPEWFARLLEEAAGQRWSDGLEPVYIVWEPASVPEWMHAALVDRLEPLGRRLFDASEVNGIQVWTVGPSEVRSSDLAVGVGQTAAVDRLHRPGLILNVGLGFDPEVLRLVDDAGLRIAPRPLNAPAVDAAWVKARVDSLEPYQPLGTVVFAGERLPGGEALVAAWTEALRALDTQPALIEFSVQRGVAELAEALDDRVVRLHSIQAAELKSLPQETVLARWLRAVRERGMRALYVRLYTELPVEAELSAADALLSYNVAYVTLLTERLEADGFVIGPAEALTWPAAKRLPAWQAAWMFTAIAVFGLGLARRFVRLPWAVEAALVFMAAGGLTAAVGLGFNPLARQAGAFAAAVLVPSFAVLVALDGMQRWQFASRRNCFWSALIGLLAACCISFSGALLVAGLLAEPEFMLALNSFLGVKAMHVVPPLFVAGAVIWQGPVGSWRDVVARLRGLLSARISVAHLLVLGLLGVIAFVTVMRTGNDGLPVAAAEAWLRDFLEHTFGVRPRNKEFLLGHPMFVLAAGLLASGLRRPGNGVMAILAALASVGQLSIVNTFAHIHTPFAISVARTLYGSLLGAVLGLGLLAAVLWRLREPSESQQTVAEPGELL